MSRKDIKNSFQVYTTQEVKEDIKSNPRVFTTDALLSNHREKNAVVVCRYTSLLTCRHVSVMARLIHFACPQASNSPLS